MEVTVPAPEFWWQWILAVSAALGVVAAVWARVVPAVRTLRTVAVFAKRLNLAAEQTDVVEGLVTDYDGLLAAQAEHAKFVEEQFVAVVATATAQGRLLDSLDGQLSEHGVVLAEIRGSLATLLAFGERRLGPNPYYDGPERRSSTGGDRGAIVPDVDEEGDPRA